MKKEIVPAVIDSGASICIPTQIINVHEYEYLFNIMGLIIDIYIYISLFYTDTMELLQSLTIGIVTIRPYTKLLKFIHTITLCKYAYNVIICNMKTHK